jgi:hypothetical protein
MKDRRYRNMLISLLGITFCLGAPIYGQTSKDDFDIVKTEFKGKDDTYTASIELLRLKTADTPPKQRLKTLLDSLLYDGTTEEAYLKKLKQDMSDKSHGSYYEKLKLDITGKYLRIERSFSACIASCSDDMKQYVINTQTFKRLSHNDFFVNANNAELTKLITKHLQRSERYNEIDKKELDKSLKDKTYEVSFEKEGVNFHWNKYQIAAGAVGRFDVVIPRSEIEKYLTPAGKELLRGE